MCHLGREEAAAVASLATRVVGESYEWEKRDLRYALCRIIDSAVSF